MEWWYKSEKYSVSSEYVNLLVNELVGSNSLRTTSLYEFQECFYLKTTNNIKLHSFLFRHDFEEIYKLSESVEVGSNLLYGNE